MIDYSTEYINDPVALLNLPDWLDAAPMVALDIETINWWDREAERISIIQLACREGDRLRTVIIDALAGGFDPEPLRKPLELSLKTKAIHNAGFDAIRLARYHRIRTSPIHDTMLAARRNGERQCSLKAQAAAHLGLDLDKHQQRSDWSRRPLSEEQLRYAALDAVCTLLLYEKQIARGLRGDYELKASVGEKPDFERPEPAAQEGPPQSPIGIDDLNPAAIALLGIIIELEDRYSPEQLAVSVGSQRVGIAGWIVDRLIGFETELDEDIARLEIARLCEKKFIRLGNSRRLTATDAGTRFWRLHKLA